MESNKLGKKIEDWAATLGFTLPNGSAPPANHFALLTATPHRRQLWETLVELIQPRQKIESMRKQIVVAKLKERKKYSTSSTSKQVTGRFDLWHKQNTCEADIKQKRNEVIKLERVILTKASDSVFEVCKLSELEKLLEEITEKSVVLKLLTKRKMKIKEDFEMMLSRVKMDSGNVSCKSAQEKNSDWIKSKFFNPEECKCLLGDYCSCELLAKIEDDCKCGLQEECLWEEVIKCKAILLDNFSKFLESVNSCERSLLCEKEREIEETLNASITKVKQKATEKSVQTLINWTNGKLLDGEIEKVEESLLEEACRAPREPSLNESFPFLVSGEASKAGDGNEKMLKNLKNCLRVLEAERYGEFLKEELLRVEEEMLRSKLKDSGDGEEGFGLAVEAFESVVEDINSFRSEEHRLGKEVIKQHGKLETLALCVREELKGKADAGIVQEAAGKLRSASEKHVALLLETPLDVFRTVGSSSGRVLFECESASTYLNNYGGELKQFFSSMLIPPLGDVQEILSEVERRKKLLGEMKKVASERVKLAALQRRIKNQLSSVKYDTRLCEKNFKEVDGVLWNVLCKTDELLREVEFIETVLNNWVEQPYRSMIKESFWGKSLKDCEERYTKGKNE